ncbi:MAG: chemotaxis protein CheD [Candidatus Sulfotelmatobacter sp.]|jgi:chemotaxis protein CheD
MADIETELLSVYLQPGEMHIARAPSILRTILGSCVGVTFWSQSLGIGALCHGVLPICPPGMQAIEGYRYVDFAIRNLIRQFEGFGAARSEVQVKVFGGADVLPVHVSKSRKNTVGYQNWHIAIEVLEKEKLHVSAQDVGGSSGRTIQFNTWTGEVLLRRLTRKDLNPW